MTEYEYDPNLPYVVAYPDGTVACRTDTLVHAEVFRDRIAARHIIDTTPKPRVPDDAKWIFWRDSTRKRRIAWYWGGESRKWMDMRTQCAFALEDRPGVTPDTVFTVLDERKD